MHTPSTSPRRTRIPWLEIALLLFYILINAHHITRLPPYADEGWFVRWTRATLMLDPGGLVSAFRTNRVLLPLILALLLPLQNALWAARTVIILIDAIGVAALMALGRSLMDRRSGLLAALLFATVPFAFFFRRMALADSAAESLVLLSAWLAVISVRRRWRGMGRAGLMLTGMMLAAALMVKISTLGALALPVLAWLLIGPRTRQRLIDLGWIYGAFVLCIGVVVALISVLNPNAVGGVVAELLNFTPNASASRSPLANVGNNLRLYWEVTRLYYVGGVLLLLGGAGAIWALVQAFIRRDGRALYILSISALGMAVHLPGGRVEPRYLVLGFGAFTLLAAWMLGRLLELLARLIRTQRRWTLPPLHGGHRRVSADLVFALVAAFLFAPWVRFMAIAHTNPAALPLHPIDEYTYITGDLSGFGVDAAAGWLLKNQHGESILLVNVQTGICYQFDMYLYGTGITCTKAEGWVLPDTVIERVAAGQRVIVIDDSADWISVTAPRMEGFGDAYRLTRLGEFRRPGTTKIILYDLTAAGG
jgi:hypothetical protein